MIGKIKRVSERLIKRGDSPYNQLIYIDPGKVNYCTIYVNKVNKSRNTSKNLVHKSNLNRGFFPFNSIGTEADGNWDLPEINVQNMPEYIALYNYIYGQCEWLETNFSLQIEKAILKGYSPYGYNNIRDYRNQRPKEVKKLIDGIEKNGLKPKGVNLFNDGFRDNIQVNVGRDGNYLFQGGFHRFCISKIIGIKVIPTVVIVRHKELVKMTDNLMKNANHEYQPK